MKFSVSRVTFARGLKQGGFTLVETLVVLGLSLVMMAAGTQYVVRHTENLANDAASDHLKSVSGAASKYAQDNEDAIRAALSSAPTASVSIPMLKAQGYLPVSMSETNNYGQQYAIRFVMSPNDTIEGLVVTQGGDRIKDLNKRKIAQSVGAAGGHLDEDSMLSLSGAYGGWSRPLADFGMTAGEAELAYALFVDDAIKEGGVTDHYMSRKEVAGSPELNQMLVDLDMDGNDLNNVGTVNAESAVITNIQAGELTTETLRVEGDSTFDGRAHFRHTGVGPLVERTNSSGNSTIEYKTSNGSVFAGAARGDTFAIGGAANVNAAANRWFEVTAGGAKVGGADVWTTATFDPDTKAEKEHLHDASQVSSGVLADARIPSLNASKINAGVLAVARIPDLSANKTTSGVFNVARIPDLNASKVTAGVLDLARIPALPISKVTGLQGALDEKLNLSGGTMRGALSLDAGNRPLSLYGQGSAHAYMQWFVEPSRSTRSAYLGFGSSATTDFSIANEKAGGDIALRPGAGGVVKVGNNPVWHTGTFNPDSKADAAHKHDASDINTGTLAAARIPSLDASKIASGVLNPNRIPDLNASKITAGTLGVDRIPTLPISKVSGLQTALDKKADDSAVVKLAGTQTITGAKTFTNRAYMQHTSGVALQVERTNASVNSSIQYSTTGGSIYAGQGSNGLFAVGSAADLSSAANRWFEVNRTTAKLHGDTIWTAGNFDPATKANVSHSHSAADITSGTLNAARIPNLDASKITAGTLAAARIPNLDASKITSGTFDAARIPTLPISKISGLQAALDGKAPISAPRFTNGLALNNGYFELYAYSSSYGSGRMQSYYDANNARWNLGGRNSSGSAVDMTLAVQGIITVKGNEVWHRGNFNPDTKADASHNHSAANITSGTLNAARIPTLAISKISGLQAALDSTVKLSGDQTIAGTKTFSSHIRSWGNTGWINGQHGGGWYMKDSSWIRAYNDKHVITGGTMRAGTLHSTGNVEADSNVKATLDVYGRYIRPQQTATCNATCSTNGLIARTSSGAALSCDGGKWKGYSCGSGGGGTKPPPVEAGCDCWTFGPGWEPYSTGCWKPMTGEIRQCL